MTDEANAEDAGAVAPRLERLDHVTYIVMAYMIIDSIVMASILWPI